MSMEHGGQSSEQLPSASSSNESPNSTLQADLEPNGQHLDHPNSPPSLAGIEDEIWTQVQILLSTSYSTEDERASSENAIRTLAELARTKENVNLIIDSGAVAALLLYLESAADLISTGGVVHMIETLTHLAIKPTNQQLIVNAGALPHLVNFLKRRSNGPNWREVKDVIGMAACAIAKLAFRHMDIQSRVRIDGGIPPLVELLKFHDLEIQRAAVGALRVLADGNQENKNQIVQCEALPTLLLMLASEYVSNETAGLIGTLVASSSPNILKEVLLAGALQPLIGLLRSSCSSSQWKAAWLLGILAANSDSKVHMAQRGAIDPLINMLQSPDTEVRGMSAFALGMLAEDVHNQAGIAHSGGITPLLNLLDSKNGIFQDYATYALYLLANNEDNIANFIVVGGVQKLLEGTCILQQTVDRIAVTLRSLEQKTHGRVLERLLHLIRSGEKIVQRRVSLALCHICSPEDLKKVFIETNDANGNNGLDLLLEVLASTNLEDKRDASKALLKLADKADKLISSVACPPTPTLVCLSEEYANRPTASDVTSIVRGAGVYALKCCLTSSSQESWNIFASDSETDDDDIGIGNTRSDAFNLMMRYLYSGSASITPSLASDFLEAADQFHLDGLKYLCEGAICQDVSVENVSRLFQLAQASNAMLLRKKCVLFILKNFATVSIKPWYPDLIQRMLPATDQHFRYTLSQLN